MGADKHKDLYHREVMAAAGTETDTPNILMADNYSGNFKSTMECDEKNTEKNNQEDQSKSNKTEEDLLADDVVAEKEASNSNVICSLAEDDEQSSVDKGLRETGDGAVMNHKEKDPLSLSMFEATHEASTRSEDDYLSETDDDMSGEEYSSEEDLDEEEESKRMSIPKMQLLKTIGHNGEITITEIPPHIQITRIPETKEDRLKREQELARRKEAAKNCEGIVPSPIKRKHSDRMTLEDVKRDDFEETQDYVDFIQSKLKNISIKQCK